MSSRNRTRDSQETSSSPPFASVHAPVWRCEWMDCNWLEMYRYVPTCVHKHIIRTYVQSHE